MCTLHCNLCIIHLVFVRCTVIEKRFESQEISPALTKEVKNVDLDIKIQICSGLRTIMCYFSGELQNSTNPNANTIA